MGRNRNSHCQDYGARLANHASGGCFSACIPDPERSTTELTPVASTSLVRRSLPSSRSPRAGRGPCLGKAGSPLSNGGDLKDGRPAHCGPSREVFCADQPAPADRTR